MSKYKVLIADSRYPSYDEELSVLEPIGAEVIIERSDDEQRIADIAKDVDGMIVNLAPITRKVISGAKKCKCVSRYGVGYDNVDVSAVRENGIYLANVPDYCGEDVSDQAFALFMDCVRMISRKDEMIREGKWNLTGIGSVHRICGRVFGFVGFGMIARFFCRKLSGFNLAQILVADPLVPDEVIKLFGVKRVDLDTLCRESDYISIHAPLLDSTRGLIGEKQFSLMKKNAILINTSRGPVINESAMIKALRNKQIACAGLDVFETEPLPADNELRLLDNVVLTDHSGWHSAESIVELKTKAAQNIADTLLTGKPRYEIKI